MKQETEMSVTSYETMFQDRKEARLERSILLQNSSLLLHHHHLPHHDNSDTCKKNKEWTGIC